MRSGLKLIVEYIVSYPALETSSDSGINWAINSLRNNFNFRQFCFSSYWKGFMNFRWQRIAYHNFHFGIHSSRRTLSYWLTDLKRTPSSLRAPSLRNRIEIHKKSIKIESPIPFSSFIPVPKPLWTSVVYQRKFMTETSVIGIQQEMTFDTPYQSSEFCRK